VWNWIMEPLLFATIGTSIVFKTLPSETIPKSLLVVCTGGRIGQQLGVPQLLLQAYRPVARFRVSVQIACSKKARCSK
jgi:hypothetical protein